MKQLVVAACLVLLAVVATAYAYGPVARVGFYLDDQVNIQEESAVHMRALDFESIHRALFQGHLRARPVANLSFALDHLHGGLDPAGFHRTNVLIHFLSGLALFWLTSRLSGSPLASSCIAIAFLAHPLATQAVTYLTQRMTSLAALFVLVSLASWVEARRGRRGFFALSGVAAACALGSKEISVMLFPVLLLYEVCLHRDEWAQHLGATARRWLAVSAGALAFAGIALVAYNFEQLWDLVLYYDIPDRAYTPIERMLTETRVVFFYLSLWLWPAPSRLNLDHEFALSTGLLTPATTLLACTAWLVIAGLGVWLMRTRPRYGFVLLAFLAFNAIESGPLPIELVFEHRFYLPMTMLFCGLGIAIADTPPLVMRALCALTLLLCLPLAAATHARNLLWADPIAFYTDSVDKSPNSYRPLYELGTKLGEAGRYAEAAAALRRALEQKPEDPRTLNQLGTASMAVGEPQAGTKFYQRAVRADPGLVEAFYNLASAYDQAGHPDLALPLYRRFLELAGPGLLQQVQSVGRRVAELEHNATNPR